MSNSTTLLETVEVAQAAKETTVNQLFDAHSPSSIFGRHAEACSGLTWGYYGGSITVDGVLTAVANGTLSLTASLSNFVERTRAGVVSANTSGFTAGRVPLYLVVCGGSTVTSYTDYRQGALEIGVEGRLSLSVAGSSNVTLTAEQARNHILNFTGALTGNINVIVPNGPQTWTVTNSTTGSYTLTVKTSAGTGIAVTQSRVGLLLADGTNVIDAAGAAGVQYFTESTSTASPNNVVNVSAFTPVAGSTDADAVFRPKGTGALLAQVPDSTTTGGNKRGSYSVDLQMLRSNANEVASGLQSVIVGGLNNRASGNASFVGGGTSNHASSGGDVVCGGQGNVASGGNSVVAGGGGSGAGNTASGLYSVVIGGSNCVASSTYAISGGSGATASGYGSTAIGPGPSASGDYSLALQGGNADGFGGVAFGLRGKTDACTRLAYANYRIDAYGEDGYSFWQPLILRTTDATPTALTANNAAAGTSNQMLLRNSTVLAFSVLVAARRNSNGDAACWTIAGAIKRGANAASTALLGTPTVTQLGADAGASGWTVAAEADTTNGCLKIKVAGQASATINWSGDVRATAISL